jgi:hypothetical protein
MIGLRIELIYAEIKSFDKPVRGKRPHRQLYIKNFEKMVGAVRFELASHFIGFPEKTRYSQ